MLLASVYIFKASANVHLMWVEMELPHWCCLFNSAGLKVYHRSTILDAVSNFIFFYNLTDVHVSLHSGPAFTLTMAGKHAINISVVASCRTSVYTATLQARKPPHSWLSRVSYTTAWQAHRPPPARGSADYSGQPKRIRLILTSLCGFTLSRLIHPPLVQYKFKATANWVVCQNAHCELQAGDFEMTILLGRHFAECLPGDTGPVWFRDCRYRWANCLTAWVYF